MAGRRTRAAAALWLLLREGRRAAARLPRLPIHRRRPRPRPVPTSGACPPGIPEPVVPADNPMSGREGRPGATALLRHAALAQSDLACATCHQQRHAFTDGRARAIGSTGGVHPRSAMSLTNAAYNVSYGWADPSLRTLEAQMQRAAAQRAPRRDGRCRARRRNRSPLSDGRRPGPIRRGISRRPVADAARTSSRRSPRSSARSSRVTRRSIAISIVTTARRCRRRRRTACSCSFRSGCAAASATADSTSRGRSTSRWRRPIRSPSSTTPVCTTSTAPVRIRRTTTA